MGVTTTKTNKPFNPRGNDQSPLAFNKAAIYSGKALDFDGVNDNIAFSDFEFTAGNKYSLCIYANRDVNGMIWSRNNQWLEISFASGALQLRTYDTGWNAYILIDKVPANEWHQIIITYDVNANTWESYLNGQFVKSITAAEPDNKRINRIGSTASGFYDGEFANAKIFDVALTAAQIADLYNFPEKIVPTGVANTALKLWLPMQEGAGTTAYDGSGNGNHGTISGATYVNGVGAPVAQTAVIDWNKGSNLLPNSEYFEGSPYLVNFVTLTANAAVSPEGLQNAYNFVPTTNGSGNHRIYDGSGPSIQTATQSVFIKPNGHNYYALREATTTGASIGFDFTDNSIIVEYSTGGCTASNGKIEDYGNGWYRISGTFSFATATNNGFGLYAAAPTWTSGDVESVSWAGDGTSGAYIWGAQLSEGSLSPYIPTLATTQPSPVLLPQGLTAGRDITGVNLFENVRKQGALNLDGNSWAEVHDNASFDFGTDVSLEAWVYWQGDTNDDGILGRYGNTTPERDCFLYAFSGGIQFYVTTNPISYSSMTNGWRHIVGTYDGANKRLYVDGVLVSSNAETATMPGGSIPMEIGRYKESSANTFTQPIAQPRIYNRALTAEEVQKNYSAGKNIYTN